MRYPIFGMVQLMLKIRKSVWFWKWDVDQSDVQELVLTKWQFKTAVIIPGTRQISWKKSTPSLAIKFLVQFPQATPLSTLFSTVTLCDLIQDPLLFHHLAVIWKYAIPIIASIKLALSWAKSSFSYPQLIARHWNCHFWVVHIIINGPISDTPTSFRRWSFEQSQSL